MTMPGKTIKGIDTFKAVMPLLLLTVVAAAAVAEPVAPRLSPLRPVSTYSIVARDRDTGELGVAVQSHWFSVGSVVPWARAGVGAVATQSMVDPSYGPLGLDLMAAGRSAEAALNGLLIADSHPEIRQVAMVDAEGRVAAHTGDRCIPEAGHYVGEGYSVQANLMGPSGVPEAMSRAYENATGPLPERLVAALAAAQEIGGDIRGRQSAALLVVRGEATGRIWEDVVVDLRVEDDPDPVAELARLLKLHRGYEQMNAGDLAVEEDDLAAAQSAYASAESILGDNLEARFWHAVALVNAGEVEAALPIFADVFRRGENWRTLTPRLVEVGFLEADDATLARILAADD
jgi:uncharacterized Ntn-hydrolase superfamily protein